MNGRDAGGQDRAGGGGMAEIGRKTRGEVWKIPAIAFAGVTASVIVPGSPWGPERWPTAGLFGAFTWTAWFVSTGLAITLLFLAARLTARPGSETTLDRIGRAVRAALSFGLLAASAYLAAASAEAIQRNPAAALGVALAGMLGLRGFAARLQPVAPRVE